MKTQFKISLLGMIATAHRGSDMRTKQQSGFTLVELAVVVFLIGMIATMGLTALKAQLVSASTNATKKKQDTIKDALVAYLAKNKRLPCPAVNSLGGGDAASDVRTATSPPPNCITNFGIVPYAELGLPKSAALDGWENFFTYAVSPKWTATFNPVANCTPADYAGMSKTCSAANAFNVGNPGQITVNDRMASTSAAVIIADPTTGTPPGAVVVLISHGANGCGAYTAKGTPNDSTSCGADETINIPNLSAPPGSIAPAGGLFQRSYTDKSDPPGGAFDDVVTWLNPSDLLNTLIKDRALQSPYGQFADQVANIREWVVGYILSNNCLVPQVNDFDFNLNTDPWGNTLASSDPFKYTTSLGQITSAVTASTTIYTLSNTAANQTIQGPKVSWLQGTYQKCNN